MTRKSWLCVLAYLDSETVKIEREDMQQAAALSLSQTDTQCVFIYFKKSAIKTSLSFMYINLSLV